MTIGATENAILAHMQGKNSVDDSYRGNWDRGFNSLNQHQHLKVYNNLVAAVEHLQTGWRSTPRLVKRLAAIVEGNGAYNYALTEVNPNEGTSYDPNLSYEQVSTALFGKLPADVRQAVINNVREKFWGTTVHARDLAAGGLKGVYDVAQKQAASLETSDYIEEWELVWTMLQDAATRNLTGPVTAPAPVDADTTAQFLAALSTAVATAKFPTTRFNPSGVKRAVEAENLVCIIRSSALAQVRLAYQGAYNLAYAKPLEDSQFEEMPDSLWTGALSEVQYILIEKVEGSADSTIVVVDNYVENHVEITPTFGRANHLRTHGSIYGVNPFRTFVVGRNGAVNNPGSAVPVPVEMEFTVDLNGNQASELRRGWDYDLAFEAKDENGFNAGSAAVTIEGATSTHTFISPTGLHLFIGLDEDAETLTLTATSALNETVTKTVTLPVTGVKAPITPPYGDSEGDNGGGGDPGNGGGGTTLSLNPTNVASFAGNTIIPGTIIGGYSLRAEGVVGGEDIGVISPFETPIELEQPGDQVTVTAVPDLDVTLTGTTTRTLSFQAG